jgi:ribosome-binding factor A
MKYKRSSRVAEFIRREISLMITVTIKDPGVKTVTITHVDVSDDLKIAKIYYRVIGDDQAKENAIKGLERANKFIRAEIGQRIELRYVPEIQFFYDSGLDNAYHIEMLLQKLNKE